jgi:predicted kinase
MVYTRRKRIHGKEYLYEQESQRVDGKVKTRFVRYLGAVDPVTRQALGITGSSKRNLTPEEKRKIDIISQNKRRLYEALGNKKYEVKAYQKLAEKSLDSKSKHYNAEARSYSEDRKKQHQKIIDDFILKKGNAVKPSPGEKPTVIFLGGPSGSGKTNVISKLIDKSTFVELNSDDIKEKLPEYVGLNATLLHEESADIYDRAKEIARQLGINTILDATLKNTNKAKEDMELWRASGYNVQLLATNLDYEYAVQRATDRAIHKIEDGNPRVVAVELVANNTEKVNQSVRNLQAYADAYALYDTNVPKGADPVLISQGTNKF